MGKKKNTWFPPPELPCTGVESHAHLTHGDLLQSLPDVIARARQAGVAQIGQIFLGSQEYHTYRETFSCYPEVFFILGIHPTEAFQYSEEERAALLACVAGDSRIKAIGEIGLDYHWKEVAPALQKEVFVHMLHLARECELPVVIHCRDAVEDTMDILMAEQFAGYPLLWHCFGGNYSMAQRILDAGWHISVPGIITYPSNSVLREAVEYIPADRLLVETDCPYLAPVPCRGKTNEPAFLGYTIQAMADAKRMDAAALWTLCGDNARRFFALEDIGKGVC